MFLWGFSGSGKTAIAMEAVKIKVSHCKATNKSVRVIVTKYYAYPIDENDDSQLLTNMIEYLKNIEDDVQILTLNHTECRKEEKGMPNFFCLFVFFLH